MPDMKRLIPLIVAAIAAAGCVSTGSLNDAAPARSAAIGTPADSAVGARDPFPQHAPDNMPKVIIPVTGGPPVIGIPVGGGLFVPVTGGPPVMGIPTAP